MQERNRESSKRSHKSRFETRRVSKKNSSKSKSKELNPVEKRNQIIENNKKKSFRSDNQRNQHLVRKNRSSRKSQKSVGAQKVFDKNGKHKFSKKIVSKETKVSRSGSRIIKNLVFNKMIKEPECAYFGFGFIVAYLLLLISSVDTIISEGLFFIYLGVLLIKRPRIYSQGIVIDIFAIGIVLYSLSTFLPNLMILSPEWKVTALNQYGINLGFLRTIMPLKSIEAIVMLLALILFYYHITSWKLNKSGREALLIILVGISVLVGALQYLPGVYSVRFLFPSNFAGSPFYDYSDNLNFFYLIGGLGAVALFCNSLKSNKLVSIIGLIGASSNFFYIIYNQSVFYFSLFFVFSFSLIIRQSFIRQRTIEKLVLLIILLSCLFVFVCFNQALSNLFIKDLFEFFVVKFKDLWWIILGSIEQLNIFGNGIATAHAIMPQLSPLKYFIDDYAFRGSYSLSFISDFGLLGLFGLLLFYRYSLLKNYKVGSGSRKRYHFLYASFLTLFLTRFFTHSGGLSIGMLLFLLMFLHLRLRVDGDYLLLFSKKYCQLLGILWVFFGMVWITTSFFNLPFLYDVRYRLSNLDQFDKNVNFSALSLESIEKKESLISATNPNKYFLEAYQLLESRSNVSEIAEILNKSIFLDRNNPEVLLQCGYLLSDYDLDLACDYWFKYFEQDTFTKLDDFIELIYYSKNKHALLSCLESLSYLSNSYAIEYALILNDLDFQKYISTNSINLFYVTKSHTQFKFLKRLLEEGLFNEYDEFIQLYENEIIGINVLEAIKQKELANFDQALILLRSHIVPEKIDIYKVKKGKKYFPRVFLQNYPDIEMGMVLIKKAINEKNYEKALIFIEHILSINNPPENVYYWKAELLYRKNEYIDSWFAFMTYLERAGIPDFSQNL